jgi:hypothetical protein
MILIIGLFLLAGAGSAAAIPDQNSTITSSTSWVVVNHQATITITALNTTSSIPVPGASVTATLNSTTLGSLTVSSGTTDTTGQVNFPFLAGTKTGAVNITATITYNDNGNLVSVTKVYTQNIDHDVAQNAVFDFQNEVTVGTETPFNISFTDQYGNPIDNRNPYNPPIISLWISASSDNMAAFNISGSHVQYTSQELDANGNISVSVVTDTAPGENEILLSHFGNVGIPWGLPQFIYGINNGVPYSIDESVLPSSLTQPADNGVDHVFTINNTVYDKYGNPTENQGILVQSNWAGDPSATMLSNPYGQIMYTYGPHSASGYVVLTATSVANSSVSISKTVQFYNTAPVNMLFSATPQVMPSLDAKSGQTAQLVAKVVDTMGNPVANQTVTFSLGTPTYTYANSSLAGPQLLNTTAVTNINGTATVLFVPGRFDTNKENVSYDATDSGYVTATATWSSISQPLQLSWKNYPYLSELTTISSQNVNVNGKFYVTVSLTADGWNLTGTPADVVIVSDLAAGIGGATRLTHTKAAEVGFIKNATDNTYVALASFGSAPNAGSTPYDSSDTQNLWNLQLSKSNTTYTYRPFNPYGNVWDYNLVNPANWNSISSSTAYCFNSSSQKNPSSQSLGLRACVNATSPYGYTYLNPWSDSKIDADLMNAGPTYKTTNQNALVNTVNAYTAYGGTDYAAGINAALQELQSKGNPSHNQTIIIMGDGVNMMAPIAPGSFESYWPSDWNPRNGTGISEGPNLWYLDESDVGKAAALNASTTAKNLGITIYGIQFPTPDNYGHNINDTAFFQQMVSSPTSTWYYAPDPTTMTGIFQQIEGQIQNTAGVNTTMAFNLQSVAVNYNNVSTTYPGNEVFSYVYDANDTPSSTQVIDQNGITTVINQTDQWNNNQTLIFNIGKMTVGQTWSTTFELQLLKPGTVNVPGNLSTICFNTGECMSPNQGTINGVYNYSNTGFSMPTISITDLQAFEESQSTNIVPLQWNISYPGSQYATETLYYNSQADPTWRYIYQQPVNPGNWTQAYDWNVGGLPAGTYSVELIAYAHDANSGKEIIPTGIQLGLSPKAFIRLQ